MGSVGSPDILGIRTEVLLESSEVAALAGGHGGLRLVF